MKSDEKTAGFSSFGFSAVEEKPKSKQIEFEEWAKNLPDPDPVLAGGTMNSPKPDLGPFRDPSLPEEDDSVHVVPLMEVAIFDVHVLHRVCEEFFHYFEESLLLTRHGNHTVFFVNSGDDRTGLFEAFLNGYLAAWKNCSSNNFGQK